MPTWPSPRSEQLGAPNPPAIRFTRGTYFGAYVEHVCQQCAGKGAVIATARISRPAHYRDGALVMPLDFEPDEFSGMWFIQFGLAVEGIRAVQQWRVDRILRCALSAGSQVLGSGQVGRRPIGPRVLPPVGHLWRPSRPYRSNRGPKVHLILLGFLLEKNPQTTAEHY